MASVLIVEDEETDRELLGNIALGMVTNVHYASDGVAGRTALRPGLAVLRRSVVR